MTMRTLTPLLCGGFLVLGLAVGGSDPAAAQTGSESIPGIDIIVETKCVNANGGRIPCPNKLTTGGDPSTGPVRQRTRTGDVPWPADYDGDGRRRGRVATKPASGQGSQRSTSGLNYEYGYDGGLLTQQPACNGRSCAPAAGSQGSRLPLPSVRGAREGVTR